MKYVAPSAQAWKHNILIRNIHISHMIPELDLKSKLLKITLSTEKTQENVIKIKRNAKKQSYALKKCPSL